MFVFQILAFLALLCGIAWKFKVQLVEAFPVGCAGTILLLYLLSFFRALPLLDGIAVLVVAAAVFYVAKMPGEEMPGEKREELLQFVRRELLRPGFLTAFGLTILVTVCVSGKMVSWWDDYNFWATDVKSLFYLGGFAGKYANVAAEFGDYPPGTQMMKWWFLHFSPGEFKEGLMFAGYYFANLCFLFPLLKTMKRRNPLTMAAGAALLWLFPAVAEVFWCDGCCADLSMALVYGCFLAGTVDGEKQGTFFYYMRQALLLMVLVLMKNTGFIWASFGLLFDYGYHFLLYSSLAAEKRNRKEGREAEEGRKAEGGWKTKETRKRKRWALVWVTLLPILTEVSWLGFCLMNRRVARLTGTAIQMATGSMHIPDYQEGMVKAFIEAFTRWPLHRWNTVALDISPLALYVLLLLLTFLLYRFRLMEKKMAVYIGGFLAVTGAVFYAMNLVSHLTIFAVETQYLQPFGMASSIERYGAPFAIGGLYLLAFYLLEEQWDGKSLQLAGRKFRLRSGTGAVLCGLFVLLTTDYNSAYRAIYGYWNSVDEVLAGRAEVVDETGQQFLDATGAGKKESSRRVLYLRDVSDISWVRNTYLGFEAAPVSVMFGNIDGTVVGEGDIVQAVENAHAGFLYVDPLDGGDGLFDGLLDGAEWKYSCLYKVEKGESGIRLVEAENVHAD